MSDRFAISLVVRVGLAPMRAELIFSSPSLCPSNRHLEGPLEASPRPPLLLSPNTHRLRAGLCLATLATCPCRTSSRAHQPGPPLPPCRRPCPRSPPKLRRPPGEALQHLSSSLPLGLHVLLSLRGSRRRRHPTSCPSKPARRHRRRRRTFTLSGPSARSHGPTRPRVLSAVEGMGSLRISGLPTWPRTGGLARQRLPS